MVFYVDLWVWIYLCVLFVLFVMLVFGLMPVGVWLVGWCGCRFGGLWSVIVVGGDLSLVD